MKHKMHSSHIQTILFLCCFGFVISGCKSQRSEADKEKPIAQTPKQTQKKPGVSKQPVPHVPAPATAQTTKKELQAQLSKLAEQNTLHAKHQRALIHQGLLNISEPNSQIHQDAIKHLENADKSGIFVPKTASSCALKQLPLANKMYATHDICQAHLKTILHGEKNRCNAKAIKKLEKSTNVIVFSYKQAQTTTYALAIMTNELWYSTEIDAITLPNKPGWHKAFTITSLDLIELKNKTPALHLVLNHWRKFNKPRQFEHQPAQGFREHTTQEMIITLNASPSIIYSMIKQKSFRKVIHERLRKIRSAEVLSKVQHAKNQVNISSYPRSTTHIPAGTYDLTDLNYMCLTESAK